MLPALPNPPPSSLSVHFKGRGRGTHRDAGGFRTVYMRVAQTRYDQIIVKCVASNLFFLVPPEIEFDVSIPQLENVDREREMYFVNTTVQCRKSLIHEPSLRF